jgi:hypothetical protein
MNCLVAARAPATAALQERRMVASSNQNYVWRGLLLEMAFEAKVLVSLHQHFIVHRPVRVVAGHAAFTNCLVFKYKGAALRDMALGAGFVLRRHREWRSDCRRTLVRIVAVAATHLPMRYRVGMRKIEAALHLQMTIETHFRRPLGIDNGVSRAAALGVQAARTMATLAADVLRMDPVCFEPRVCCCGKVFVNLRVAFGTGGGPDKLRARNFRWNDDHSVYSHAGYQDAERDERQRNCRDNPSACAPSFIVGLFHKEKWARKGWKIRNPAVLLFETGIPIASDHVKNRRFLLHAVCPILPIGCAFRHAFLGQTTCFR